VISLVNLVAAGLYEVEGCPWNRRASSQEDVPLEASLTGQRRLFRAPRQR